MYRVININIHIHFFRHKSTGQKVQDVLAQERSITPLSFIMPIHSSFNGSGETLSVICVRTQPQKSLVLENLNFFKLIQ